MPDFVQLLSEIQRTQTEISWFTPERDFGLQPTPGATQEAIRSAERRLKWPLPPSYRSFLATHDGWPRFFEGASLLGANELGRRLFMDSVQAVFAAAAAPVRQIGRPRGEPVGPSPVPFGADATGTTFFAFNPRVIDRHGEYEVICWVNEIGLKCTNFTQFLAMVLEHCGCELAALTRCAELSA